MTLDRSEIATCLLCGETKALSYFYFFRNTETDDAVGLCRRCHRKDLLQMPKDKPKTQEEPA